MTTRSTDNAPTVLGVVLNVILGFPEVDQHRCVLKLPSESRSTISNSVASFRIPSFLVTTYYSNDKFADVQVHLSPLGISLFL